MTFSARDVARDLLIAGTRPYATSEMRELADAFSSQAAADVEARMVATVMRTAWRELGITITSPDALCLDSRQVGFLVSLLGGVRGSA